MVPRQRWPAPRMYDRPRLPDLEGQIRGKDGFDETQTKRGKVFVRAQRSPVIPQAPHRVTDAFWWAWVQTWGNLFLFMNLKRTSAYLFFFYSDCWTVLVVTFSAAGAVCAERVHPSGAGPVGPGPQTVLPASAGSSRELPVQPAAAHRSVACPLLTQPKTNAPTSILTLTTSHTRLCEYLAWLSYI